METSKELIELIASDKRQECDRYHNFTANEIGWKLKGQTGRPRKLDGNAKKKKRRQQQRNYYYRKIARAQAMRTSSISEGESSH